MSDEFDKEAEREKLEEKYERDKQKRQATEQMSELLLQGATMTNAHCSECGDPIFRYEEQEFCPTCEKPVDRGTGSDEDDESEDSDSIQVTTPSNDAHVSFGQGEEGEQPAENGRTPDQSANEDAPQQPQQTANRQPEPPQQTQQAGTHNQPTQSAQSPANPQPSPQTGGEASVAPARDALIQTLTRFSQQAAAADDPARAQEHLAAAREAAEALAALRQ